MVELLDMDGGSNKIRGWTGRDRTGQCAQNKEARKTCEFPVLPEKLSQNNQQQMCRCRVGKVKNVYIIRIL